MNVLSGTAMIRGHITYSLSPYAQRLFPKFANTAAKNTVKNTKRWFPVMSGGVVYFVVLVGGANWYSDHLHRAHWH
jgi:hypothetical protein